MQRHLQLVGVRPEKRDAYLELHARVWPLVEARITASNITNYSIFIHGDLLVAYFEYVGVDLAADMAAIADDPTTREWWKLTDPCQSPLPGATDASPWVEASEVWHLP
jgi:L-rhamnose mutarotase